MKKINTPLSTTIVLLFLLILSISSCSEHPKADMLIRGGTIYTANPQQPKVEAVALVNDKIVFAGKISETEQWTGEQTELIDLQGKTMTPGWIEGHGHIMGMGYNEINIDLLETKSYDELIEKVKEAAATAAPGEWIVGRGWHQSKWDTKPEITYQGFQTHDRLSAITPDNPVYLRHASGHAGMANAKAMELAGVSKITMEKMTKGEVEGGEIIKDEYGNPTGIFNERATTLITRHIPENNAKTDAKALSSAIAACHRHGVTGFHVAGTNGNIISLFREFKKEDKLDLRLYVMLTGWDKQLLEEWYEKGPEVDTVDNLLTIRSIKLNCDGALGSRGAWLLQPYTDRPDHYGHETLPMEFVEEVANKGLRHGFQVCAHAIGDRANREILDRYESALKEQKKEGSDHRFRIEHAQHLHPEDIPRFAGLGVIPAMQCVHMSSDRPWAIDRLGEKRIKEGAYMWQALLKSGAKIVNGSDVPVEPINPIASFYAAVTRKTLKGQPEEGYESEQRMTREQALNSYTIDAAYGAFEENIKGSIEVGKLADFTVFSQDIMTVDEEKLLDTEVEMTVLGGRVVYQNDSAGN